MTALWIAHVEVTDPESYGKYAVIAKDAIEAHGGLEAWYAAATRCYTWEYANVGADLQFKTYLVADNRSRHVYHDFMSVGSYGSPDNITGRMAWDGDKAWIWPASIEKVNPRFWATTGYYFEQIPFVLADPGLTYERLEQDYAQLCALLGLTPASLQRANQSPARDRAGLYDGALADWVRDFYAGDFERFGYAGADPGAALAGGRSACG